ncbi:RCC1/BLIP-II [Polyplosphaeria fusca]|uniref:RCC1/BLIP-II n=1 Tax=Polyplosphaeria fusca TaxID=682080 RepID=A0A9P4R2H7_9PLEO|nr:RCC1/BLIP-II [Polyplosphaeria fusca]
MPPKRPARAVRATKPTEAATIDKKAHLANGELKGAGQARAKKAATPAATDANEAVKPATGRGRAKKADTPAAESNVMAKRAMSLESDEEPKQVKKRKVKEAEPAKFKPKGPMRRRGVKTIINELRYTTPLKVFVFGEGSAGELGLGADKRAIDVKRPRYNELLSDMNVVKIACGGMHVIALTQDNKILTWGVNDNGALGRDTSQVDVKMKDIGEADDSDADSDDDSDSGLNPAESTPGPVSSDWFPDDTEFVDVAAGDSCSFALTTEGAVYGWGTFRKNEGILGFARNVEISRMPMFIEELRKITHIQCGTNHALALDHSGQVFAWGNGQQNQLGRRLTERNLITSLVPTRLGFMDGSVTRPSKEIVSISCGDYHAFAIAKDGHIWSWGANNYCEAGHPENAGQDNASIERPQVVQRLESRKVIAIEGGSHHNVALTSDGECLVWGRCDGSQTGIPFAKLEVMNDETEVLKMDGKPKILLQPTAIPGLQHIVAAGTGPDHTLAIDKDGKAFAWGFSSNYQTGLGTDDDVSLPTQIANTAVKDTHLVWAGAGGQYSMLASHK